MANAVAAATVAVVALNAAAVFAAAGAREVDDPFRVTPRATRFRAFAAERAASPREDVSAFLEPSGEVRAGGELVVEAGALVRISVRPLMPGVQMQARRGRYRKPLRADADGFASWPTARVAPGRYEVMLNDEKRLFSVVVVVRMASRGRNTTEAEPTQCVSREHVVRIGPTAARIR